MNIFEFLRSRKTKSENYGYSETPKGEVKNDIKEEELVYKPQLSLLELNEIDWSEFGTRLKREKLLPPSYDRKPKLIKIGLSDKNIPQVELTFMSTTTPSTRKLILTENGVMDFTNGYNPKINDVWNSFKNSIRMRNELKKARIIRDHVNRGRELKKESERLIGFKTFFEDEEKFLEKHQNDEYEFFGYFGIRDGEIPMFVTTRKNTGENVKQGEMVYAFSPKTLEHCVTRLIRDTKMEEAEDIDSFVDNEKTISLQK